MIPSKEEGNRFTRYLKYLQMAWLFYEGYPAPIRLVKAIRLARTSLRLSQEDERQF